jgi:multiple sugar transport system substrate-binding protein
MSERKKERSSHISRRDFLRVTGIAGAGLVINACSRSTPTPAPSVIQPGKTGLAEGMIGGPTGFEGAERYQYPLNSPAGRAIEALRNLSSDKKPKSIKIQLADGALGHFDVPFPEGAPPVRDVFVEETGIELDVLGISPDDQLTKIIQDTTTRAGQFDIYSFWNPDKGSLYEAGAIGNLNDFVEKYKPEWEKGYVGGLTTVLQFNTHAGNYVCVDVDGDYQIWQYRRDLFEDDKEQNAFKSRYGWDLQWPETYEQLWQVAEFFHRPDQNLWGMTDLRNRYWGFSNWYQTYGAGENPNALYFNSDDGKPLIFSEAGVRATKWHVDTLRFHSPDGISWGWPEQYANFAAGGAAMSCMYPNAPKFLDNPDNPDSVVVGKMRSGITPGYIYGNQLVRRPVWWPNITLAVSSQSKYAEASYLLLQWLSSTSIYTWMTGNPAGYFDPFQVTDFQDPIVRASYKDWHIPIYQATIERSIPPITLNGTNEYVNALDDNLQAAMTGAKTAEQAMEHTASEWEKITDRLGRDKQIVAMRELAKTYPKVVDAPTITM